MQQHNWAWALRPAVGHHPCVCWLLLVKGCLSGTSRANCTPRWGGASPLCWRLEHSRQLRDSCLPGAVFAHCHTGFFPASCLLAGPRTRTHGQLSWGPAGERSISLQPHSHLTHDTHACNTHLYTDTHIYICHTTHRCTHTHLYSEGCTYMTHTHTHTSPCWLCLENEHTVPVFSAVALVLMWSASATSLTGRKACLTISNAQAR